MGRPATDMTGQRIGMLTVVERAETQHKTARWLCRCDCGGETIATGTHLRAGRTTSCGCLRGTGNKGRDLAGDAITYKGAHGRVKALKGSPRNHRCVDCGDQADDWSLVHGLGTMRGDNGRGTICDYSPDPLSYEARCRKCHRNYDR